MDKARNRGVLDRGAAADLWRNTLCHIPSAYGRLVYLSSLRNQNSGRYEHHGLSLLFGDHEADKVLRKTHVDTFNEWLNYSLEQQKADLDLYISALSEKRAAILKTWIRLAPYRGVIPAEARDVEKQLFLTDLEATLELLRNALGVASPDPDA